MSLAIGREAAALADHDGVAMEAAASFDCRIKNETPFDRLVEVDIPMRIAKTLKTTFGG